jgi:hypothetical protein
VQPPPEGSGKSQVGDEGPQSDIGLTGRHWQAPFIPVWYWYFGASLGEVLALGACLTGAASTSGWPSAAHHRAAQSLDYSFIPKKSIFGLLLMRSDCGCTGTGLDATNDAKMPPALTKMRWFDYLLAAKKNKE